LRRFIESWLPTIVLFLMVGALVAVVLFPRVVVTVPSGHVGVLWKRFEGGTVLDPRDLREEGVHFIMPWDKLFIYNLRVQTLKESYSAISKDGVNMVAALNTRYRLAHDSVPTLHQVVGPDYKKILGPMIASLMRQVIAEYTAEQVYSTARQEIQDKIRRRALEKLGHKMMERDAIGSHYNVAMRDTVVLYDTLLFGIDLPRAVVNAINRKAEQYYIAEEYNFRLTREKRESERKRIEAEGIRDFQRIVSKGISDSYLRWRGVEATLQLAQSTNSKVVIIGGGKDGLPIILGNADALPPPPAPTPPADGAAFRHVTPAAAPTMPIERMPPGNLATPREKVLPGGQNALPGNAPAVHDANQTAAAASSGAGSVLPFSLPDITSFYQRLMRPSEPVATQPPTSGAQPRTAAE
jgi:regulator of protease activity HflC (stomatin/prohibitin superfamily)